MLVGSAVAVAQQVEPRVVGPGGRGFDPRRSPSGTRWRRRVPARAGWNLDRHPYSELAAALHACKIRFTRRREALAVNAIDQRSRDCGHSKQKGIRDRCCGHHGCAARRLGRRRRRTGQEGQGPRSRRAHRGQSDQGGRLEGRVRRRPAARSPPNRRARSRSSGRTARASRSASTPTRRFRGDIQLDKGAVVFSRRVALRSPCSPRVARRLPPLRLGGGEGLAERLAEAREERGLIACGARRREADQGGRVDRRLLFDRGEVTAASSTSVTVKRADGPSVT